MEKKPKVVSKAAAHHSRQARLLAQMIDQRIDARVSRLESAVEKMFRLFKKIKGTSSPKRVLKLEDEVNAIKDILEDFNVKHLEEDIFKRFNEINAQLTQSLEQQKAAVAQTKIDIAALGNSIAAAQPPGSRDEEMKRDLESLKVKAQWLELELEKVNMRPLMDRLDELEARMDSLRISQPTIIE